MPSSSRHYAVRPVPAFSTACLAGSWRAVGHIVHEGTELSVSLLVAIQNGLLVPGWRSCVATRSFSEMRAPYGVQRWATGDLARSARPIALTPLAVLCGDGQRSAELHGVHYRRPERGASRAPRSLCMLLMARGRSSAGRTEGVFPYPWSRSFTHATMRGDAFLLGRTL